MTDAYMPKAKTHEWQTPRKLFDKWWEEFGPFDLDPACRRDHYTARRVLAAGGMIYTLDAEPEDALYILRDGLTRPWNADRVFVNPPYGAPLSLWVPKMRGEVENGNAGAVIALLPVRADLAWWHDNILSETRIMVPGAVASHTAHPLLRLLRFQRGRLRFEGPEAPQSSATFASVIVGWWK